MKKRKRGKRVHRPHANGLFDPEAAYWKGERAERIVKRRVIGYTKKHQRKT